MVTLLFFLFDMHLHVCSYVCLTHFTPGNLAEKHHLCQSQALFWSQSSKKTKQPKIFFLKLISMLQFLPDAKLQLLMFGCVENAKIGDSTRIWKFAFFFSVQGNCMYMYIVSYNQTCHMNREVLHFSYTQ